MTVRARAVVVAAMLASACGAKGPPLPPLRPVPGPPSQLTIRRAGDRAIVRLQVPAANTDPAIPLSISGVEIYARTLPFGSQPPTAVQLMRKENLVHTIAVRPAAPETDAAVPAPVTPTGPVDLRPAPGDAVVWMETIALSAFRPLDSNRPRQPRAGAVQMPWMPVQPSGLSVPTLNVVLPTRYYIAVGLSDRRRPGTPSAIAAVPLGPAPVAPTAPVLTFTESALTLAWTTETPGQPVTVIESTSDGREQPTPVQEDPISAGSWSTPFVFGVERCFVVRRVSRRGNVYTESVATPPVCATPVDIFGPPAPTGLVPVSEPDGITLVWDAVTAPDLAGYLVLRGEGAGETLQPLTPKPITSLQYSDSTARTGQRYVYAVVAVDQSGNLGPQSGRVIVDRWVTTRR